MALEEKEEEYLFICYSLAGFAELLHGGWLEPLVSQSTHLRRADHSCCVITLPTASCRADQISCRARSAEQQQRMDCGGPNSTSRTPARRSVHPKAALLLWLPRVDVESLKLRT